MEISNSEKSYLGKAGLALLIVLSLYFAMKTISEIKNYNFIGGGAPASNTITFDGKGEVSAKPDLATINFTIREDAKEVKDAQNEVTVKETAVLDFLDKSGIEKKDIKTESYNSSPKYEWRQSVCSPSLDDPRNPNYICPPGKNVLTGYEVSEYISVKIHDLAKTGEIVKGLGAVGVTEINGPNFSIENEDQLKAQARKIAIDEAKAKAEILAKDLGVRLVRIVNFSENGNYPMMYANKRLTMMDSAESAPSPTPELPTGENKITSNVTITYEIR
ncbi:MAG: SIMPL domain-containing protein [Patescibacteria group bacterium]